MSDPAEMRRAARNRYERWKADERAAAICGMDVSQLRGMRELIRVDRSRGRRPAGTAIDLHAPVKGQLELFPHEGM